MTSIMILSKKKSTKDVKQLAQRAERIIRDLDSPDVKQLRKDAGKLARDVRAHANTMRERTADTARAAKDNAPSRKQLEQRREDAMEKVAATAGLLLPLVPMLARRAATHKSTRRMVVAAPMVAVRTHPVVLGVSVASAGYIGYRMWKRRAAAQAEQMKLDQRHDDFSVARMEGEGGNLGAYDSEPPSLSSIGSGRRGSSNGLS